MFLEVIIQRPISSILTFANYISDGYYSEPDIFIFEDIENEIIQEVSNHTDIPENIIKNIADYTVNTIYNVGTINNGLSLGATSVTVRIS